MLDYIKEKLIGQPNIIKELLEFFGFSNVRIRNKYISFGRDEKSSSQGVSLYLENNEAMLVKDWSHNESKDIFNYIISEKEVSFKTVIDKTKVLLNISDTFYGVERQYRAFGGFYHNIKKTSKQILNTYSDDILDKYDKCGNKRFIKDGLSLNAQRFFDIGFSIEDQAITIPIRNELGRIIGIKARANYETGEDDLRYWYLLNCPMSQTLYGYSHNYQYLESADIVYVVESEKTVIAAYSYGVRNIVALGSGTISKKQVELLLQLSCNSVVFLHDTSYKFEFVERNIMMVKTYARMRDIKVGYWNNYDKNYDDKLSPTDRGENNFKDILENEITYIT